MKQTRNKIQRAMELIASGREEFSCLAIKKAKTNKLQTALYNWVCTGDILGIITINQMHGHDPYGLAFCGAAFQTRMMALAFTNTLYRDKRFMAWWKKEVNWSENKNKSI